MLLKAGARNKGDKVRPWPRILWHKSQWVSSCSLQLAEELHSRMPGGVTPHLQQQPANSFQAGSLNVLLKHAQSPLTSANIPLTPRGQPAVFALPPSESHQAAPSCRASGIRPLAKQRKLQVMTSRMSSMVLVLLSNFFQSLSKAAESFCWSLVILGDSRPPPLG